MARASSSRAWGRGRRLLTRALLALGLGLCLLVLVVLATANLRWVRARVAQEVSALVSREIAGTLVITRIGHIGLGTISGVDAELVDLAGHRVLEVTGGRADLAALAAIRHLIGGGPLSLRFERVLVSTARVDLHADPSGQIAALAALEPTASQPEKTAPGAARPLRLRFDAIRLEEVQVRGAGDLLGPVALTLRELAASGRVDERSLCLEVQRARLEAREVPTLGVLAGELFASIVLPLDDVGRGEPAAAPAAELHWRGAAADIPVELLAVFARGDLSGFVRARAPVTALRKLLPAGAGSGAALEDAVDALLTFDGDLERLRVRAVVESAGGDLYADGEVALSPLAGRWTVIVSDLDMARWSASAPSTSLQLVAALAFEREDTRLTGRLSLRSEPTLVEAIAVPALAVSARLSPQALSGTLDAVLAGAAATLELESPRASFGEQPQVALRLRATVGDARRALRALGLQAPFSARGGLEASGTLQVGPELSLRGGRARASWRDLRSAVGSVARATLHASAEGALDDLQLGFRLDALDVRAPGYALDRVQLSGSGDPDEVTVRGQLAPRGAERVRLSARLFPRASSASNVLLRVGSGQSAVRLSVRRLERTPSGLTLRDVDVRGPGRVQLDAALDDGELIVDARATDFSAAELARRLGLELRLPEGVADLVVRARYRRGRLSGAVEGTIRQMTLGPLGGCTLQADLTVEQNVTTGFVGLHAGPLGQVQMSAQGLALPSQWPPSGLAALDGKLELLAVLDVARLARVDGLGALTGAASQGTVHLKLELLEREGGGEQPRLYLGLATRDLVWSIPPTRGGADATLPAPLAPTWQDMDVELTLALTDSVMRADAILLSAQRSLIATLHGTAHLPLERLLRAPASFDPRDVEIDVRLEVPARRLGDFPPPLRFAGVGGSVSAELTARGRLGRPALGAHVELSDLHLDQRRDALPLALVADAQLRGDRLTASVAVHDEQQKRLSLRAEADVPGRTGLALRSLELDLRSNGLPLQAIGALFGLDVAGELYGDLSLATAGAGPFVRGTLWVHEPSFAGLRQRQARWVIDAGPDAFATQLELRQLAGGARATLRGPWRWNGAALPAIDRRRVRAALQAEGFDLRALDPLLPRQVRALGGKLDADLALDPASREAVRGSARVREGRVYVEALGQEFRDVALDTHLDTSGRIQIEQLSARALRGRLSASGQVEMEGLALRAAQLRLDIPRSDPLPLMFEGVTVASGWGRLDLSAKGELTPGAGGNARAPALTVEVAARRLTILLPGELPRDVQELTDDPTITAGTYLSSTRFITLPVPPYDDAEKAPTTDDPPLIRFEIELGDVWVEREPTLELKLLGSLRVDLQQTLTVQGQLRVARGDINIQGRVFEVERGIVTFLEEREPANPTLLVTGVYTAPEGTRVIAEFVGPVETGKLILRAEPPLRDDQILSLLLFGSPDGSLGATSDGTMSGTALLAGGSLVTHGLNLELRRLTSLDIRTRIGERQGEPQPEVVVQVTPRLTAELAYRLEAPTPGRTQDRTYLTLDLRLFRNWSLSATLGDAGSFVLDLLWRYRY